MTESEYIKVSNKAHFQSMIRISDQLVPGGGVTMEPTRS